MTRYPEVKGEVESPCHRIQKFTSTWIKDLNEGTETITLREENKSKSLWPCARQLLRYDSKSTGNNNNKKLVS